MKSEKAFQDTNGLYHCERCGKAFIVPKELLLRSTQDEEEEAKQAGFCSSRCLYQDYREEQDRHFLTDYNKGKKQ